MNSYYNTKLQQILSDEYQKSALESKVNTVVLAGPGSGKTTLITLKIKHLLEESIFYPRGLACMTFSKDAAKEFITRLDYLDCKLNKNLFLGTIHSFCLQEVLYPFAEIYNKDITFPIKIISKKDKRQMINNIIKDRGLDTRKDINVELIDSVRSQDIIGRSRVSIEIDCEILKISQLYEEALKQLRQLDYVSIIKLATEIIIGQPYVRKSLEAKYPWILIDEYQDLGRAMHEIVLCLEKYTNIKFFIVGDLDQSIYSFQGAIPDYLEELSNISSFTCTKLINNYRSSNEIIEGSLAVLGIDRGYLSKNINKLETKYFFYECNHDLIDQYNVICGEIIPHCVRDGIRPKDICVLVRGNQQIEDLCYIMREMGISHFTSKNKFDRTELIKIIENMSKIVLDKYVFSFEKLVLEWLAFLKANKKDIKDDDMLKYKKYLLNGINESAKFKDNLSDWILFVLEYLDVQSILEFSNNEDEIQNLETFLIEMNEISYQRKGIRYLSNLNVPSDNQVTVSTCHSAKGLEFEVVIIIGLDEGVFPYYKTNGNQRALNEENRICFVSVSRAKRICYLLRSRTYTIYSKKWGKYFTINKSPSIYWNTLLRKFGNDKNLYIR